MEPKPVVGQREYMLRLRTPAQPAQELAAELVQAFTSAGAAAVEGAEVPGILRYGGEGPEDVGIHVEGLRGKEGPEVVVRIRPERLDPVNFWPAEPLVSAVTTFVERHDTRVGRTRATTRPQTFSSATVPSFAQNGLLSRDRDMPIVLCTPGRHTPPATVERLARDLAGIANVWTTHDEAAPERLVGMLGKFHAAFGGAVRIYRPGFTSYDDPRDHDLMVAHYLDLRLMRGWTLSHEIARRLLPLAGPPLPLPRRIVPTAPQAMLGISTRGNEALAASPAMEPAVRRPSASERIEALELQVDELADENTALRDENRNLNAALRAAKQQIRDLEVRLKAPSIPQTRVPGLPWPLENPRGHPVTLSDRFSQDVQRLARDGSLAEEVRNKMEAVLAAPDDYGDLMRGARKGQRKTRVSHNYRLVWSVDGGSVRFVLIVSKEDPEYSPFGA